MIAICEDILAGQRPPLRALIDELGGLFPLLGQLHDTPQDPEWHGEGDVGIHTEMVLQETYKLLQHELSHWPAARQLSLILGALFHDVAKPLTTRTKEIEGRERIVAPRHPERGRDAIVYKLLELELPYQVLREVLAIVGHHHDPKWLVIKDKPACKYHKLSRIADLSLLYYLEQADLKGRICLDLEHQLDELEYFRLVAEESSLFGMASQGADRQHWRETLDQAWSEEEQAFRDLAYAQALQDREQGLILMPEEAIARAYRYKKGFAKLVVMCGPSGSGKSHWIEKNLPDYEVLCLDDIREELTGDPTNQKANSRVRQIARERLKPLLQHHKKVVWDATNLRRDFRHAVVQLGCDYGALVTLVAFHMQEHVYHKRNEERARVVPRKILQHQLAHTEWPHENEAHRVMFVSQEGDPLYATFDPAPGAFR